MYVSVACLYSTQVCIPKAGIIWNFGTIRAVFYRDGQPLVKPVRNSMKVGREELKWQNGSEIFNVPCFAKHLTRIIIFPWCVVCTVAWSRALCLCNFLSAVWGIFFFMDLKVYNLTTFITKFPLFLYDLFGFSRVLLCTFHFC